MKSSTSLRLLAAAALATPLLAFWPQDQESEKVDWQKHVQKACESRRYGIRLAAARKVGAGGDAAVPAVRAYADKNGRNKLPASLVDAIADSGQAGDQVVELLYDWTSDDDFYWRSSAMRGLAIRVPQLRGDSELHLQTRAIFKQYRGDPAWLMRTHAKLGGALLGHTKELGRNPTDRDPRARVRLTTLLLKHGRRTPKLQPLFDALADERTFLGDPWGPRLGAEAHKALKTWLGDDHPLAAGGSFDDKQQGIAALIEAAQKKSGQTIDVPAMQSDQKLDVAGGIEIRSCKYGDRFLQWTADGTLHFGLTGEQPVRLDADGWAELMQKRTDIALDKNQGVVICDSLRVRVLEPDVHVKVAPDSLPKPAAEWLKHLADRLEETGRKDLAANLRRGLGQFAGR